MKKTLLSACCCLMLMVCNQKRVRIPETLKNHPERASFTKLDETNNQAVILFKGKDLNNFYTYNKPMVKIIM